MKIKYTYLIIIALLILSGVLAYDAFTSYINPYLTVSQVVGNNVYLDEEIQVIGIVANESTRWGEDGSLLFNLTDGESAINVTYRGSPPPNFNEGEQVVVIGKLTSLHTVEAYKMLVKCPSKYGGEGRSLLNDPVFLTAMLLGAGAIVYSVVSIASKRKKSEI